MRFGPHTAHVEVLLAALGEAAVRRSPGRRRDDRNSRHDVETTTYRLVMAAGRLEAWDEACAVAAQAAVPSLAADAANAAGAIVASDLIDEEAWNHLTTTARLASLIHIPRPGGHLAERCACGVQLGRRFVAARTLPCSWQLRLDVPTCRHTTASLPTGEALDIAFALVRSSEHGDWDKLIEAAQVLAD